MSEEIDTSHHSLVEQPIHSTKTDLDVPLPTAKSISLQSFSSKNRKLSTKMSRSETQLSKTSLERLELAQQKSSRTAQEAKQSLLGIAIEKVTSVHSVIVSQVYVPPPTPVQVSLTPPQQLLTQHALSETIYDKEPQYNEATDAEEFDAYMKASDHDLRFEQPVKEQKQKRAQTAKQKAPKDEVKRVQSAKPATNQPKHESIQGAARKPLTPKPHPQASHLQKQRPQTTARTTKQSIRPFTAPSIPTKADYIDDRNHTNKLFSLRTQVRTLRKDILERDTCIIENTQREQDYKEKLSNLKASFNDNVARHSRIHLDRQKRQSIITVSSLKMEVRRLKFERNSLSDPTIEVQYYPYLPRTSFGTGPRNPPVGILGNCASKTSDFFVMNPPPASGIYPTCFYSSRGTHEDGGNVYWWGKEEIPSAAVRTLEPKRQHSTQIQLGSRVSVIVDEKRYDGTVKYVGLFDGSPQSGDWCGVRLDEPVGRHDGVVHGKRYFPCKENHGFFAKMSRITLVL